MPRSELKIQRWASILILAGVGVGALSVPERLEICSQVGWKIICLVLADLCLDKSLDNGISAKWRYWQKLDWSETYIDRYLVHARASGSCFNIIGTRCHSISHIFSSPRTFLARRRSTSSWRSGNRSGNGRGTHQWLLYWGHLAAGIKYQLRSIISYFNFFDACIDHICKHLIYTAHCWVVNVHRGFR